MRNKSKFEMVIVERVRQVRLKKNLTQDDIAMFLNISRGFVGQIESPNHQSKYSLDQLNKLAIEMECSLHDFIPEKPIPEAGKGKGKY
ncbi:MAG TPA: helix-turn-helix transcriptional regulator [Chryseosolibacter sp.]